jgi:hypothetical protein
MRRTAVDAVIPGLCLFLLLALGLAAGLSAAAMHGNTWLDGGQLNVVLAFPAAGPPPGSDCIKADTGPVYGWFDASADRLDTRASSSSCTQYVVWDGNHLQQAGTSLCLAQNLSTGAINRGTCSAASAEQQWDYRSATGSGSGGWQLAENGDSGDCLYWYGIVTPDTCITSDSLQWMQWVS